MQWVYLTETAPLWQAQVQAPRWGQLHPQESPKIGEGGDLG